MPPFAPPNKPPLPSTSKGAIDMLTGPGPEAEAEGGMADEALPAEVAELIAKYGADAVKAEVQAQCATGTEDSMSE